MAIRARLPSRPIVGTAIGASAILAIACSPAGGMPGMRADLVTSRAPHAAAASVSPVTEVSKACAGQNAEVVTATGAPHYVYGLWIGCGGIGFARSTGYATYLRPYSPGKGWTGPRVKVSTKFGNRRIWPGDTFGIAPLPGGPATRLALSWGGAVSGSSNSEIYAAVVTLTAAR